MASLFEPVLLKVDACHTVPQICPAVEKGSLGLGEFSTEAVFFVVCSFALQKPPLCPLLFTTCSSGETAIQ